MQSITISGIQADLIWEDKSKNLQHIENKIVTLSGTSRVVVLPEMFSTGFTMNPAAFAETMDGVSVNWMKRVAAENKLMLTGSLIIEEKGCFYNRMIWMQPDGHYGYYDKRHLFAFAGEDKFYTPGNKRLITSAGGWRFNLQVCYDLRFPVWARQQNAEPEYDVLVYVANWPEIRSHAWKLLLTARAIENQCYVIGVNRFGTDGNGLYYSGDSVIVNPLGETLQSIRDKEGIISCTLHRDDIDGIRKKFPFLNDADTFKIF